MKHLDRPLARRTLIKGAGLGLVAGGMADTLLAQGAEAAPADGGEIWSQEYWTKKGDIQLLVIGLADLRLHRALCDCESGAGDCLAFTALRFPDR